MLVVDDSLTVREVERRLLENRGYEVTVAVDGMDGWNAVQSSRFDLVVTDVDMPRMDGIELVKRIKGSAPTTSIPGDDCFLQGPGRIPDPGPGGGRQLLPDQEQLPRRNAGECGPGPDWGGGKLMRIAIVNDLALAVEVLRRIVQSVPEYEVAWTAADGIEAVEKCARDCPDLILMDLIMPLMDGAQATRIIMKQSPCAILVVTATVAGNADKVFEALSGGALDAVATPGLRHQRRDRGWRTAPSKDRHHGEARRPCQAPGPGDAALRASAASRHARRDWWRWERQREAPTPWPSSCAACRRIWERRWSWCNISTCSLPRGSWIGWVTRRDSRFR